MSLFQFGFTRCQRPTSIEHEPENRVIVPVCLPTQMESGLGRVEFDEVTTAVLDEVIECTMTETPLLVPPAKRRRGKSTYTSYKPQVRAKIGKYALENGNERARRHFSKEFPNLAESTIRSFKKSYHQELEKQRKKPTGNPQPVTMIAAKPKGRPPLLLDLDERLVTYLKAVRVKGGVVNIHVVRAVAKALITSNPSLSKHLLNFEFQRSWVQSLYRRMGYTRRAATTGRPPIPQGLYDECRREFLQDIANKIKTYKIPPELVMNSDQTPSSYVSVGKSTMSRKGSKSVPIKGVADKRAITLNFVVTLSNEFLPMQIIYSGKTQASQPRGFQYPSGFLVTQNPNHWSNEAETLKLIDKIIINPLCS